MNRYWITAVFAASLLALNGCHQASQKVVESTESKEAKAMLQGIWIDAVSEDVVFKITGDTIFYPDTISVPACFKIVADTLIMSNGQTKYHIKKQTPNIFWFENSNGDIIKLTKSNDSNATLAFEEKKTVPLVVSEKLKTDTVVVYAGERYHCYVAINPTTYKVMKTTYTDDGVKVDNIYYDNIIHISIYHGRNQLYSRDFNKKMYAELVPRHFLDQAILSNMTFSHIDAKGFHFDTIICIPYGNSCYMLDTQITPSGDMTMELLEE